MFVVGREWCLLRIERKHFRRYWCFVCFKEEVDYLFHEVTLEWITEN